MSAGWLAQLAPDHAPPAAGWWPPAPGWWAVALLVVTAAFLVAAILRWWQDPRRRVRRAALLELRRIRSSRADGEQAAQAIESLLRRHAIAVHGRERVARLAGRAWLEFLQESGAAALAGEAGPALLAAAFGGRAAECAGAHRSQWLAAAEQLIRRAGRQGAAASRGGRG